MKKKAVQSKTVFEEIPTRKLISAYGGVGSLVETLRGAIMIEPFSEWPYFKQKRFLRDENSKIEDMRLIFRLKAWFPKLETLVRIPVNALDIYHKPNEPEAIISAQYFPKWMFSSPTRRFDTLDNWVHNWQNAVDKEHQEDLNPPKCYVSYLEAKNNKEGKKFYELEQVRFILISSSGKIADVPWDYWVWGKIDPKTTQAEQNDESADDLEGFTRINFQIDIPKNVYYEYQVSDRLADLSGISISVFDSEKKPILRQTLRGLFNLRIQESKEINEKLGYPNWENTGIWKVVLRSSNSVYYPNIISSLYIPTEEDKLFFLEEDIVFIKKKYERGRSLESIIEDLEDSKRTPPTIEQIQSLINRNFIQQSSDFSAEVQEEAYRLAEYRFITKHTVRYQHTKDWLVLEPLAIQYKSIKAIYAIDRLKLTSVQTSFTRQEPIDKDYFLTEDSENESVSGAAIKKQYTHGWSKNSVKYFPAAESFGEGIFIDFDQVAINQWVNTHHIEINKRINWIQNNFDATKINPNQERTITPQFVMIHTFCHLLIKELEFLCGYPASSLQERLYIGEDMNGFLIYTIAGSEGSYGGLVSIAKSHRLKTLIDSALVRATDCASDPICQHTDQIGQGVGGTNLAACYSCTLLPETSCEEYNRFLDRMLIIDKEFGFWKNQ